MKSNDNEINDFFLIKVYFGKRKVLVATEYHREVLTWKMNK